MTLTVVDSYGRSASKSQSITVTPGLQPTAVFTFSPTVIRVGQTVNFNAAQSRPAAGGTLTRYEWNFGDGTDAGHRRTDDEQDLRRRRHLSGDADRHGQRRSHDDEFPRTRDDYAVTW